MGNPNPTKKFVGSRNLFPPSYPDVEKFSEFNDTIRPSFQIRAKVRRSPE